MRPLLNLLLSSSLDEGGHAQYLNKLLVPSLFSLKIRKTVRVKIYHNLPFIYSKKCYEIKHKAFFTYEMF